MTQASDPSRFHWSPATDPNQSLRATLEPLDQLVNQAHQKLIICAAPRTMSSSFCAALYAAGLGVPEEYFSPQFTKKIKGHWHAQMDNSNRPVSMAAFVEELCVKRSWDGLFATKLLFDQFERWLTNPCGRALFEGATIVMLCRADLRGQVVSLATADTYKVFGSTEGEHPAKTSPLPQDRIIDSAFYRTMRAEVGWRAFFAFSGNQPTLITDTMLKQDLSGTLRALAASLGRPINEEGLAAYSETSRRYGVHADHKAAMEASIDDDFTSHAFDASSYRKLALPRPGYSRWKRLQDWYSGRLKANEKQQRGN